MKRRDPLRAHNEIGKQRVAANCDPCRLLKTALFQESFVTRLPAFALQANRHVRRRAIFFNGQPVDRGLVADVAKSEYSTLFLHEELRRHFDTSRRVEAVGKIGAQIFDRADFANRIELSLSFEMGD